MIARNPAHEATTDDEVLEVALTGQSLLAVPLLNKGSAFSEAERHELGLLGLVPPHVATLDEQSARVYENYQRQETYLERYIYLAALQDRNETLFYRLLQEHMSEMLPIIYTPIVGLACQQYSHIYRQPRGLYIAYPQREEIDAMLANAPHPDIGVIVVTDGERILGLGDLGIGGMGISVGKLTLYTLCAGIHPATTLPVVLDVGTDHPDLLNDPLYLGWHHERVRGQAYDDFIEAFVQGVTRAFPNVLLQWEDFAKPNARRLLDRYRDRLCTFNDDIQGTGAVTLAGLLAAMEVTGSKLSEQRIVILGAGSAATGIADQIVAAMIDAGVAKPAAGYAIWLVDSQGPVHTGRADLDSAKNPYAQPLGRVAEWHLARTDRITLEDVVRYVHPTALIGTAAQPHAFTEAIVRDMAQHVERPIIFPLSNPTSKSEAAPADLIGWTAGQALIATGSPFPDVLYAGRMIRIGQCNNAFLFPGVGLGVIAARARRVTDGMFVAAARALSACSPARRDPAAPLYPPLEDVCEVSRQVALAVGGAAQQAGVAEAMPSDELERRVAATMWQPRYVRLQRKRP
ncbi:MAG TPA: NAD-dependent malic enzyme [Roseiflexaceae bacterium]|jgi:malate dehydrogenase (oxaloacetate-decarboxylating)